MAALVARSVSGSRSYRHGSRSSAQQRGLVAGAMIVDEFATICEHGESDCRMVRSGDASVRRLGCAQVANALQVFGLPG